MKDDAGTGMNTLTLPWRMLPKKIEATCYNRGRFALLRYGSPLRVTLSQHRGLEVILNSEVWLCVDSLANDQPVLAWRELLFTHVIICINPFHVNYIYIIIVQVSSWVQR